jgi:hypothetical protein
MAFIPEIQRVVGERQAQWLREVYGITPQELVNSPRSVQEEIGVHWNRYWRQECTEGRGVQIDHNPGQRSGFRRAG